MEKITGEVYTLDFNTRRECKGSIAVYEHKGISKDGNKIKIYSFSTDPEDVSKYLTKEQLKMFKIDE